MSAPSIAPSQPEPPSERLLTRSDRQRGPIRIPQRVYNAFRYGCPRYQHDPHKRASWAIGRATFADLSLETILELIAEAQFADGAGEWWHHRLNHPTRPSSLSRMQRDVERKVENCRAAMRSQILDASQARLVIGELMDRALDNPWPGRTGSADQKVYVAHCQMAIEAGHINDYGASIRQLAIEANTTKITARAATERLIARGALQRRKTSDGLASARFRLVRSWGDKIGPADLGEEEDEVGSTFVPPSHPAFGHGSGLHYQTWRSLERDPQTARQITTALERSGKNAVRQTRYRLDKLEAAGLAAKDDDGAWYRCGDRTTLDQAALAAGTTKRMNTRRDRYKAEAAHHRSDRLASQKVALALRAGAADAQLLATRTGLSHDELQPILQQMRQTDYALQLPDGRWQLVCDTPKDQLALTTVRPLEQLATEIEQLLAMHGARTVRELGGLTLQRTPEVRAALETLAKRGIVWRCAGLTWDLLPLHAAVDVDTPRLLPTT